MSSDLEQGLRVWSLSHADRAHFLARSAAYWVRDPKLSLPRFTPSEDGRNSNHTTCFRGLL